MKILIIAVTIILVAYTGVNAQVTKKKPTVGKQIMGQDSVSPHRSPSSNPFDTSKKQGKEPAQTKKKRC